ncbi:MAG: YfhO family protein [Ruminococcus sp.]|nr:YfhO family protein [Ruminococcus sp.]
MLFAVIAYVFFEPANKLYGINLAGDGEDMYLPMLMNFRRTMSEFYASIRNGSPEFRMVNFDYCFGSDNYITVFNFLPLLPLYLLTPLFSESSMDEFYLVAQLVPQFLGGISFIYLCRCYGRDMLLSGLVAPAYAFTGNYFMNVVNHPQFNYMVIAFPLMVVGLDRVLERRGWKLLTFGVFFAGFSSFTFLIYTLPFLAVFALLRVWATKRKTFLSSLWKDFLLCMGAIIIGVMLTGIVLMPTLYLLFHSNRGQTDQHIKLLDLFIPQVERLGSIYIPLTKVGVYAYVMPAALMTLIPLRQKTEYKIYMLAAALVCALPLIAYGINGFMYDGYRWGFIIGLLLCYLAVAGLESFASLSRNDVFYFSLTALLFTYITTMEHEYVASVMVTAMILLLAIPPVGRAADKLTDIVIGWMKKLIGWINANKDGE